MRSRFPLPVRLESTRPGLQESRHACEECHDHWCCTAQVAFPAPAISEAEWQQLAEYSGRRDFAESRPGGLHLKSRENGYCVFFDTDKGQCGVYPARPFDCRMYPFDFIDTPEGYWWIMYDCGYSQTLSEEEIWQSLDDLETHYLDAIHGLWYRLDPYPETAQIYRRLRPLRCAPPPVQG